PYWGRRLRADDGTRTRDPHLGKVMLYQLSHIRMSAVPPGGDRCDVEDSSVRVQITSNRGRHVPFLHPPHPRTRPRTPPERTAEPGAEPLAGGPPSRSAGPVRGAPHSLGLFDRPSNHCYDRNLSPQCDVRAIGSAVERLVHTEEVTGSNPVSPTGRSER